MIPALMITIGRIQNFQMIKNVLNENLTLSKPFLKGSSPTV